MLADDFFIGTKLYHKTLSELCKPMMDYLGATHAMYVNVDKHGKMFSTNTYLSWIERLVEQQYYKVDPFMVHPNNIHSGFAFESSCDDQEFQNSQHYDAVVNFEFCHSFVYIEKTPSNGYYGFIFATEKDNYHMINRLVNEARIVKEMIRKINKNLISVVKDLPDMRMDFAALKGDAFYTQKGEVFNEDYALFQEKKISLLKKMGLITGCNTHQDFLTKVNLSPQEVNCLRLYLNCSSVRIVAQSLNLADSTVKSYVENIKNKLDCHTKSELLEKASILESFGYL